jgi:hypothetical protein
MSRFQRVVSVLNELASELGLGEVVLDERDRATLAFDDTRVTFMFTAEPLELLWLYVDLGEIPTTGDEAPAFLLQIGLGSWATGRMTIGLDDGGRRALGYTSIPVAHLDHPTLHRTLTAMLELALPIRERLDRRNYQLEPAPDDAASAGIDPAFVRG